MAGIFALLLAGCDRSNPTGIAANDSQSTISTGSVLFSETSMYTEVTSDDSIPSMCDSSTRDSLRHFNDSLHHANDSLRQVRMLGLLRDSLGLSADQYDSILVYVQTLSTTLDTIRVQVHDGLITRDQARDLVKAARDQFVASVESILTNDQLTLFDTWLIHFWDCNHHRRGGPEGHGGPRGPEGPEHRFGDRH